MYLYAGAAHFIRCMEVKKMIDFNEEIARFQPSPEVDQAEDSIYRNDMTDLADILDMVLKNTDDKRRTDAK